jgi:lauroyl/myristoyl acyltransferase
VETLPGRAQAVPAGRRRPPSARLRGEVADLVRIPLWLLQKPLYAVTPMSFHFRIAALRGLLDWASVRRRSMLIRTLEKHLGPETGRAELSRIARRHFRTRRTGPAAIMWPQVRGFAGVEKIPIEGVEHLDEALARGNGALLVSAYFGYTRLIKPILRSHGRPALLVAHPRGTGTAIYGHEPHLSAIGSFVHNRVLRLPHASLLEERSHSALAADLPADFDVRPCVEALKRNEALVVIADGRRAAFLHPTTVCGVYVRARPRCGEHGS